MKIVPFPLLTIAALDEARDVGEAAVTLPLPRKPSLELLEEARRQVLTYLDWVTSDMLQTADLAAVRREIVRAAARLAEITDAMSDALWNAIDADVKRFQADAERK